MVQPLTPSRCQSITIGLLAFANVLLVFLLVVRLRTAPSELNEIIAVESSKIKSMLLAMDAEQDQVIEIVKKRGEWMKELADSIEASIGKELPTPPR